jgi:hypothetical protein
MSMILGLVTLGNPNISRILADPPLVWKVIAPDDPEMYAQARGGPAKPGFLGRVFRRSADNLGGELELSKGEGIETNLDKSWHGIHFLLNGEAWQGHPPLDFLVASGRQVGDIDVGYGPARVFTAAETKAIQERIEAITEDDLRARFDPADMIKKEIYPEIWDRDPKDDDTLGYLVEYYRILRGFLHQAVDGEVGVVVYLS